MRVMMSAYAVARTFSRRCRIAIAMVAPCGGGNSPSACHILYLFASVLHAAGDGHTCRCGCRPDRDGTPPPPFVRIAAALFNLYLFCSALFFRLRFDLTPLFFLPLCVSLMMVGHLTVVAWTRGPPFLERPRACSLPAGAVSDSWCRRRSLGWRCAGETHGHDHACTN